MAQIHGRLLPAALFVWAGFAFSTGSTVQAQSLIDASATPTASPSLTPSLTPSRLADPPTSTPTPSSTFTPASTPSVTSSPTEPPSSTTLATVSATASPSPSASSTRPATESLTPAPPPTVETVVPPIRINEIGWAGTSASPFDEWIELANLGDQSVDLGGWMLSDGGDLAVTLRGEIPAHGFFLLERTDDSTVSDVAASLIYTGNLSNAGERLALVDRSGRTVDTANQQGGSWPAGDASLRASMVRIGTSDEPGSWRTTTAPGAAHDASGQPILGSPGAPNTATSPSATPASSPTNTPSPTASVSLSPSPAVPSGLLINEVAWAGTRASASDEWIELLNPTGLELSLNGWRLSDGGDIDVALSGTIPAGGYYLLERTDDSTISDVPADMLYTGALSNSGEDLRLLDPGGRTVDLVNARGRHWPAGDSETRASMERRADGAGWGTFAGYFNLGHDAAGNAIRGTPRGPNSVTLPQPTATLIPGALVINEVLPRPHYDWEGTGGVTVSDEFIELYNRGPGDVFLKGWWLDDVEDAGSRPHDLPAVTLSAGERIVFFRSRIHISLNDGGDTVRLLAPDGRVVDQISYLRVRAYNLSYGRLPDGSNHMAYGLWPTPGEPNLLFVEPLLGAPPAPPAAPNSCPRGGIPWPRLARHASDPSRVRLWLSWGLGVCREAP